MCSKNHRLNSIKSHNDRINRQHKISSEILSGGASSSSGSSREGRQISYTREESVVLSAGDPRQATNLIFPQIK